MKCIVTYASKYGSTKRYAQWIAEELSCDIKEIKNIQAECLRDYDVIIHGGGLYAGGVSGLDCLQKAFPVICDKKVILFTCGVADPQSEKNVTHIESNIANKLPQEMYDKITQFHFRGGIDYSRLSVVHRMMMWMLCHVMKKKGYENLSAEDRLMLDTYGKKIDVYDRSTIKPLIETVLQ